MSLKIDRARRDIQTHDLLSIQKNGLAAALNAQQRLESPTPAANIPLQQRHNLLDIATAARSGPPQHLQQGGQLEQVVDPKPGSALGSLTKQIVIRQAGPGGQHRPQPPPAVVVQDPIFTPVLFTGD